MTIRRNAVVLCTPGAADGLEFAQVLEDRWEVRRVHSAQDALAAVQDEGCLALIALHGPSSQGLDLLTEAARRRPYVTRICYEPQPADPADHSVDAAIVQGIVHGHFGPDFPLSRLRVTLERELEHQSLARRTHELADLLAEKVLAVEETNAQLQDSIKELEQQHESLTVANQALRSLDEMKDNFQANVSHELKTPLVSGMGYIELMLRGGLGAINPEQEESLGISYRNLNKLNCIIDDLLAFTQLKYREQSLMFSHFSLARLVAECVEDLKARSLASDLELTASVSEELPLVYADREKIARVFANLLANAEKFNASGRTRIELRAFRSGDEHVEVRITDNGIGIPRDKREAVFRRFHQIDGSTTRRYQGLGLGLALVREILTAHKCPIIIEGDEGQGTTFTFLLPLSKTNARGELVPVAAAGPRAGARRDVGEGPRPRVLVVDDEQHILDFVRIIFQDDPFDAYFAISGPEGLKILESTPVNLVLLDLAMEGMDGLEVCRRIRSNPVTQGTPVYMFTAMTDERSVKDAYGAGCDGYLKKPFKVQDFRELVYNALLTAPQHQKA